MPVNVDTLLTKLNEYDKKRKEAFYASTNTHKDTQVNECRRLLINLKKELVEYKDDVKQKADALLKFNCELDTLIKKEIRFEAGDLAPANLLNHLLGFERHIMLILLKNRKLTQFEKAYFLVDHRMYCDEASLHGKKGASDRKILDKAPSNWRKTLREIALIDLKAGNSNEFALCYARISSKLGKDTKGKVRDKDHFDKFVKDINLLKNGKELVRPIMETYSRIQILKPKLAMGPQTDAYLRNELDHGDGLGDEKPVVTRKRY